MRGTRLLVLPAVLIIVWLMLGPCVRSRSGEQTLPPVVSPVASQPGPSGVATVSNTGDLGVEVDGVRLGMTRSEALKALEARGLQEQGPRLLFSPEGTVKAVIDGKSIGVPGEPLIRVGVRKETLGRLLGSPLRQQPGLAGCGSDPTTCWLYSIKGGGLRIYIYKDSQDWPEIVPDLASTVVTIDLTDSLYGSYRGP